MPPELHMNAKIGAFPSMTNVHDLTEIPQLPEESNVTTFNQKISARDQLRTKRSQKTLGSAQFAQSN